MQISIMQPTYLPWIGYFDLIDQCDVFVFLDDVQFVKQSWQQRNKIKTKDGWIWLTIPVIQKFGQKIAETQINYANKWNEKHSKSIYYNYHSAAFYNSFKGELEEIYSAHYKFLIDLNINIILWFCKELGISLQFVRSSELSATGTKTERLLNICQELHADNYLSPLGSSTYIEQNNLFNDSGIILRYQHFEHPLYSQIMGDFISHLSILDLMLNHGPDSLEIIRSGRNESFTSREIR
jgi:hypothetical protein